MKTKKHQQQQQMTASETADTEEVPVPPGGQDDDDEEESEVEAPEASMGDASKGSNFGAYIPELEGTVVPKMERIPWYRWIYLSLLVAFPTAIYIMYFTAMGWGETTFNYVHAHYGQYAGIVGGATVIWFLILYMLDANFWKSRVLQAFCGTIFVLGLMLTVLFLTANYPFGPICCYAAVTPLYLLSVIQMGRGEMFRNHTRLYVTSLSGPLFFISMLTMALFIGWTFMDESNSYNQVTQVTFSFAAGCTPNLEDYPECSNTYTTPPPTLDGPSTTSPVAAPRLDSPFTTAPVGGSSSSTSNGNNATNTRHSRYLHGIFPNGSIAYHTHPPLAPTQTFTSQAFIDESIRLNQENDANVYTTEETGLCFDIVISPPSWTLDEGCNRSCPKNVFGDCPNALILWAGPLMCSMVLFFLSFFCTFLKGNDAEKDIINFGKLWLFLLFTVWITASLAGVGAGISTLLVAMTLASFVGAIFFVGMTRSKQESKEQAWELWARFEEKCGGYINVGRGIFLVFGTPILIVYFFLAIINQSVRKLGFSCSKKIKTPEEHADFVTKRARAQITDMRSWERTKVLTYGVYVGLTYMILSVVVTKFTYLLLTVLVEALADLNLGIVTAILIAFGLAFFLNPFLPGPPVYMTNGLVLFVTGQKVLGVAGALAYGVVLSVFVKLLACAMQQKGIGENLAKYVTIRKLVGINSSLIKASKIILSQPGISVDKVSILVGGPDWPTSVLCGILHLPLLPILIGTLPVVALCAPTSLMGAFLYMGDQKNEEGDLMYPYASSLGAVATAVSALVMMAAPVMAAYYLELTMTSRAKEIEAMENDKEVARLEQAEEAYNKCYDEVIDWQVLPAVAKFVVYLSFFLMVVSVYIVLIWSKRSFAEYTLTSTIKKNLEGDWTNLVMPMGWISIVLFMTSWGLIYVFGSWANAKAKDKLESQPSSGTSAEIGVEQPALAMIEAP